MLNERFESGTPLIYIGFGEGPQYGNLGDGEVYTCKEVLDNGNITLFKTTINHQIDENDQYNPDNFVVYDVRTTYEDYEIFDHMGDIYGDWSVYELQEHFPDIPDFRLLRVRMRRLGKLLTPDKIQDIKFDEIQWPGWDLPKRQRGAYCICCGGKRWVSAQLEVPGILLDGTRTYSGRRYRNIDGRHRIEKAIDVGRNSLKHYVLTLDEILPYIEFGNSAHRTPHYPIDEIVPF